MLQSAFEPGLKHFKAATQIKGNEIPNNNDKSNNNITDKIKM